MLTFQDSLRAGDPAGRACGHRGYQGRVAHTPAQATVLRKKILVLDFANLCSSKVLVSGFMTRPGPPAPSDRWVLIMPKGRSAEQRALDKALADLDRAVAAGLDAVQEHNGPVAQSGAAEPGPRPAGARGGRAVLRGDLAARVAEDDHPVHGRTGRRAGDLQVEGAPAGCSAFALRQPDQPARVADSCLTSEVFPFATRWRCGPRVWHR